MRKGFLVAIVLVAVLVCAAALVACAETSTTVTYYVDGSPYRMITVTGTDASDPNIIPTKEGYSFIGWYMDEGFNSPFDFDSYAANKDRSNIIVYAKWSINTYTATFINSDGIVDEVTFDMEDTYIIEPDVPERAGYTGTWEEYEIKAENVTINAVYIPTTYNIIYENTKGAINKNSTTYNIESPAIELIGLEAVGYIFDGWYKDDEKVESIASGSYGDITLTAKWTPITYNIIYENTKGATNVNPTIYNIETTSIRLKPIEADGYTFLGWYNGDEKVESIAPGNYGDITLTAMWSKDSYIAKFVSGGEIICEVKFDIEGGVINEPAVPMRNGYTGTWENYEIKAENITINAVYTPITYNISYENTKGAISANPINYNIETTTIVLSDIEAVGYVFNGWYNGNEKVESIALGSYGDITLIAKWTPITYNIIYKNTKGAINKNPITYDIETATIVLSDIDAIGYTFVGWYNDDEKIENISIGSHGDITLIAKWSINTYTATFVNSDGIVDEVTFDMEDTYIIEPDVPERAGYTGTWEEYEIKAENITINAVYIPTTYNIIYENTKGAINKNSTTYNIESPAIELIGLEAVGYIFDGWYKDDEKVESIASGSYGDITLTAKWIPITYNIIYENTKGAINKNSTTYNIESSAIELIGLEAVGYIFDGWYKDDEKVESIASGSYGDITLTAKWIPITYNIIYENTKGAINKNSTTYNIESSAIELIGLEAVGYIFDGWYKDDEKVESIAPGSYGDITLTAKWTPITYNIIYKNTKGAGNTNPATYNIETSTIELSDIGAIGYTFDGWYNGETRVESITAGSYGDITLTAKWIAIEYIINYELDGGINSDNNPSYFTVESLGGVNGVIQLSDPSKETLSQTISNVELSSKFYVFDGWYIENTFKTEVTEISLETGEIVLYAKWIERTVSLCASDIKGGVINFTEYEGTMQTVTANESNSHIFVGWYNNDELLCEEEVLTFDTPEADVVYTAQFHHIFEWTKNAMTSEREFTVEELGAVATDVEGNEYEIDLQILNAEINGKAYVQIGINGTALREYSFTALESGSVTIYTEGNLNTYGYLYSNGVLVANDDNGGNGNNFSITCNVTKGEVYIIKVRGYSSGISGNATLFVEGHISSENVVLPSIGNYAGYVTIRLSTHIGDKEAYEDIFGIKVYDLPIINFSHEYFYINDGENIEEMFTAQDSFGENVDVQVIATDKGDYYDVIVTAIDCVGNMSQLGCEVIKLYEQSSYLVLVFNGEIIEERTISVGEDYLLPKPGYVWTLDGVALTDDKGDSLIPWDKEGGVYVLQAEIVTYKLIYELNGGVNSYRNPSTYTVVTLGGEDGRKVLYAPTKAQSVIKSYIGNGEVKITSTNYTFAGWYKDADFKQQVTDISLSLGSATLYVKWNESVDTVVEQVYTRDGDYIYFGEYPQTIKANNVSVGNIADEDGYYLGSDGARYAKVVATPYNDNADNTYMFSNNNIIVSGKTYYFKVEPIRWRILSESNGKAFILCDSVIDNQYYRDTTASSTTIDGQTVYANNYMYSDIRTWLNEQFYNTAFGELQQALILTTEVDNSKQSTCSTINRYACDNTNDKIFLLSYQEAVNSTYGFDSNFSANDAMRRMLASDYSRATGVMMMDTGSKYYGIGYWRLRSPSDFHSMSTNYVYYQGGINKSGYYGVNAKQCGVVPALNLTLS